MKNDSLNRSGTAGESKPPKPVKILLAVLPFWDPLIPPMGISCLHSFLKDHDYDVKKSDANIEKAFTEIFDDYFETLKQALPETKRSNFYNIGKNVLRNHMMAHIHYTDEKEYVDLVRILVEKTFYFTIEETQIRQLNGLLDEFYRRLETYFTRLLEEETPDVVGISVFKGSLPASLFALRLTRAHSPSARTVMGGGVFADQLEPCSPDWPLFLEKTPYIDAFIVGEGEEVFLKYLQGQLPEGKKVYTLEDAGGRIIDISGAKVPDFSGFDLQYYPSLASYTSRSCPFQCNFCSETVRWGKYRKKGAEQIVEELQKLYETYGSQLFLMTDSLLNPVVSELSRYLFDSDHSFYWDGYLKVDRHVCDTACTLEWRRGGFYRARLGVESGSQRVLEAMGKGITPGQIKDAIKSLAHAGIKTTTYWIIGYPGETEEDFMQTLEMVEELKNDIYEAEFNPFWYYASGQVNSEGWAANSILLYPESASELLLLQTRVLDLYPSREESYRRLRQIYEHSRKLGIPNPYTLYDIYQADERWARLHKNAVPSLLSFKDKNTYIDECKTVENLFAAAAVPAVEGDWGF
jgi:radical SAM superfamily enzyme YgiQ (UPF0313 family)